MEINKIIGENIRLYRKEMEISQEAIAKKLGISQQAYLQLEKGETSWKMDYILSISDFLNVPIEKILLGAKKNSLSANPDNNRIENVNQTLLNSMSENEKTIYEAIVNALKSENDALKSLINHMESTILILNKIIESNEKKP